MPTNQLRHNTACRNERRTGGEVAGRVVRDEEVNHSNESL